MYIIQLFIKLIEKLFKNLFYFKNVILIYLYIIITHTENKFSQIVYCQIIIILIIYF